MKGIVAGKGVFDRFKGCEHERYVSPKIRRIGTTHNVALLSALPPHGRTTQHRRPTRLVIVAHRLQNALAALGLVPGTYALPMPVEVLVEVEKYRGVLG